MSECRDLQLQLRSISTITDEIASSKIVIGFVPLASVGDELIELQDGPVIQIKTAYKEKLVNGNVIVKNGSLGKANTVINSILSNFHESIFTQNGTTYTTIVPNIGSSDIQEDKYIFPFSIRLGYKI